MAYRDNVDLLCNIMGVPNPVREEDIKVDKVYFLSRNWVELGHVESTEMNRAGRLFVEFLEQEKLTDGKTPYLNERVLYKEWSRHPALFEAGVGHDVFRMSKPVSFLVQWHFAELYGDSFEKGRALILGLIGADFVGVVFKH